MNRRVALTALVLALIMQGIQARAWALKAESRSMDETATMVQAEFVTKNPAWPRANGVAAAARSVWSEVA